MSPGNRICQVYRAKTNLNPRSTPPEQISPLNELKTLLSLAFPIIVSQLAQMGINLTDTIMAGRHSDISLAGVAIGSSLWVPCFLLLTGILMAVTPMVAQSWGANRIDDIKSTIQQGVFLALALGISMMLILQFGNDLFKLMAMEPDTRAQAIGYTDAVSYGLPAMALFLILRGLNEGMQLTRPYMYVSLLALPLNIPLNYIFVYGKFGLPEMGGVGCGWATTIVLWTELLAMWLLTTKNARLKQISWQREWQKPQREKIIETLRLGIPIGISLLIESSMFTFIALFLAQLGATVVAGHQVAMSVISVLFMIPLSLSMALTIRCGFCLGKGEARRARLIGFLGIAFTLVTASLFSLTMLFGAKQIATLYSNQIAVQALAAQLLFFAAIFQFSDAVQVSAAGILRGYKDTRFAFFVVLLAYWGVGLPLGYSLGLTDYWGTPSGAQGFWQGLIAGLGLASVLLAGRFIFISRKQHQSK